MEFAAFYFDSWGRSASQSLACTPEQGYLPTSPHPNPCATPLLGVSASVPTSPSSLPAAGVGDSPAPVAQNFLNNTSRTCLFRVQTQGRKRPEKPQRETAFLCNPQGDKHVARDGSGRVNRRCLCWRDDAVGERS